MELAYKPAYSFDMEPELYSGSEDSFQMDEAFGDWAVASTPPPAMPVDRSDSPIVLPQEILKEQNFMDSFGLSTPFNTINRPRKMVSTPRKLNTLGGNNTFGNFQTLQPQNLLKEVVIPYGNMSDSSSSNFSDQNSKKRKKSSDEDEEISNLLSQDLSQQPQQITSDLLGQHNLASLVAATPAPKKRHRRKAQEIDREHICPVEGCSKAYGSEGALKMHVRLKHPDDKVVIKSTTPTPLQQERRISNILPITNSLSSAPSSPDSAPSSGRSSPSKDSNTAQQDGTPSVAVPAFMGTSAILPGNMFSGISPSLVPSTNRMVENEVRLDNTNLDFFDLPILSLKLGSWQKTSKYGGDLVATFSFAEKKLVWELASERSLFKMELPFSSLMGLDFQLLRNGILVLGVATKCAPQFYRYPILPNQTCEWYSCPDFTAGYAFNTRLHTVFFAPGAFSIPFDMLLRHSPHLQTLSEAGLPVSEQPEFLLATMEPPLLPCVSNPLTSSEPPTLAVQEPSSTQNNGSSSSSEPNFNPDNGTQPSPSSLSECSLGHRNEILNLPVNNSITLTCCNEELKLKQLLSQYTCKCNVTHFYSFCLKKVVTGSTYHHCTDCNKCTTIANAHCSECSGCIKPHCECCANFLSL